MSNSHKVIVEKLLEPSDIRINGDRPWDIRVHNEALFGRVIKGGSLAAGESYMDGWWDVQNLPEFFTRIHQAQLIKALAKDWKTLLRLAWFAVFNPQKGTRAFKVGEQHYDVGNDLYEAMLDKRLTYTCGYWSGLHSATTLDEAQDAKLDLVCRKLGLKPGQRILDIGCGWGSFMIYAAEKYGAECVGVTVSKEQIALGEMRAKGLPVTFILQDYRDIKGEFDHIVSLGMFEHVGYKNYRSFMEVASKHLKDDGLLLLHTIGAKRSLVAVNPWIDKYIFPNSMLPSSAQISKAAEDLFIMEDWHNFGADYDKTLMEWHKNAEDAWPELAKNNPKYTERFHRMWTFYLLSSAGAFRAREIQLWQIVFSKHGVKGGYKTVR